MGDKLDISFSLTKEEKRIMKKFRRKDTAILTRAEFQTMLKSKLVDGVFGDGHYWWSEKSFEKGVAHLTDDGLRAKASISDKLKSDVRYWITTGIAIMGLVLAIISLLMQHGIISLLPIK